MNTCYLYIRTASKHSQDADSIEVQKEACLAYAETHNFKILRTFYDIGVSGQTLNRKGIRDLITNCDMKPVDAILVLNISRIARNVVDLVTMRRVFSENEIRIVSVQEGILSDNSLTFDILASCIQYQSEGSEAK